MKMSALGTLLAALALAGVGVVYLQVETLSERVESLVGRAPGPNRGRSRRESIEDRIPMPVRGGGDRERTAAPGDAGLGSERTGSDDYMDPGRDGGGPESRTLEERIARLERNVGTGSAQRGLGRMFGRGRTVHSVEQLADSLGLSASQKDRVKDAVARGRQRVEDVLRVPDETGKSPIERRKEHREKLMQAIQNKDAGGVIAIPTELFSYRNRKIPGRNATYGEEIARIQGETKAEIASNLDATQQKDFANVNVAPMLGGGGEMVTTMWSSGDGEGEVGEIIVETGAIAVADGPSTSAGGSGGSAAAKEGAEGASEGKPAGDR